MSAMGTTVAKVLTLLRGYATSGDGTSPELLLFALLSGRGRTRGAP
ncbi:hypothetical protein ACVW19_001988 [Streptomyces sp. TE5632]